MYYTLFCLNFESIKELQNKVQNNLMPKGTLEDEIRSLREELKSSKEENRKLSQYKTIVDDFQNKIKKFDNF